MRQICEIAGLLHDLVEHVADVAVLNHRLVGAVRASIEQDERCQPQGNGRKSAEPQFARRALRLYPLLVLDDRQRLAIWVHDAVAVDRDCLIADVRVALSEGAGRGRLAPARRADHHDDTALFIGDGTGVQHPQLASPCLDRGTRDLLRCRREQMLDLLAARERNDVVRFRRRRGRGIRPHAMQRIAILGRERFGIETDDCAERTDHRVLRHTDTVAAGACLTRRRMRPRPARAWAARASRPARRSSRSSHEFSSGPP